MVLRNRAQELSRSVELQLCGSQDGISFDLLPLNVFDNEYFGWSKHRIKEEEYQIARYNVIYGRDEEFSGSSYWTLPYHREGRASLIEFDIHKSCSEFKIELLKHAGAE